LIVDTFHSYTPVLITAGLLPVLGTAAFFLVAGPICRLQLTPSMRAEA